MNATNYKLGWEQVPKLTHRRVSYCAVLFACLIPGLASAANSVVSLESGAGLPDVLSGTSDDLVSSISSTKTELLEFESKPVAVIATASPGRDIGTRGFEQGEVADQAGADGLSDENVKVQDQLVLPAFADSDTPMSRHSNDVVPVAMVVTDSASGNVDAGNERDELKLPYALVLALLALIGMVPVSRRKP